MTTSSTLRICTFNVHAWGDAQGRTRLQETIALLRELTCDVLVLNEVLSAGGALERVADALSMHSAFGAAGYGGNAVLTRAKPGAVENVPLEVRGRELRSALCVEIDCVGGPLLVAATHLDDRREDARVTQLQLLQAHLARAQMSNVIAGDFNAVRTADYVPERLAEIAAMRARHGRESRLDDVARALDAWGYVDAIRLAHAGDARRYREALTAPLPETLAVTCWAGTRVDMVWLDPLAARRFRRADARVVDTDVSDHRPVVVELDLDVATS